jgi:integrase
MYKRFIAEFNEYLGETEVYFTMHQFRHTFCTMLYNAGVDVKTAQDILGHSSVNVTLNIYTHLESKMKKINTDKLNKYTQNYIDIA